MASGTVPLEKYEKLAVEYGKLSQKYKDLEERHAKTKAYIETANKKYNAAKASAKLWREWIQKNVKSRQSSVEGDVPTPKASALNKLGNHVTSSQTTEGDPEITSREIKDPTSDGEPALVSFRSLKRRKMDLSTSEPPQVRIKDEPTSPGNPIEIRSDEYSDPPLKLQKPMRTETSDLGALVQHMDTPRKRNWRRATSEGAAETLRPPGLPLANSSPSKGNEPNISDDIPFAKAEAASLNHGVTQTRTRDIDKHSKAGQPLRERSVNIPSPPKTGKARAGMERKRKRAPDPKPIALFSEDGEDQTSQVMAPEPTQIHAAKFNNSRLDSLLDEPPPNKQPLPQRRAVERRSLPNPKALKEIATPATAQKSESHRQLPRFQRPRGIERSPPPAKLEDEPLRLRPLKSLRLDDFKINLNYVGSNFAFADTFRGREQRRCLQGCTRPECCGNAFSKAVEIGGTQGSKSDKEVLEEYLGPDFTDIMAAYGPERRNEITKQAHAYAFANRHGKHRHAFERRSTPPGFWRTDMPSTQEEEQDRAAALEIERKTIEERWREAQRNGRWVFKDE